MTAKVIYLPLNQEMEIGEYEVMFSDGTTGRASKTKTYWVIIEDSVHRETAAEVIAYKKPTWKPKKDLTKSKYN